MSGWMFITESFQLRPMTQDQRYEYTSIEIRALSYDDGGIEKINEVASEGWELKETVEVGGGTTHYIFERPVE